MKIVMIIAVVAVIAHYLYWNQRPGTLGVHNGKLPSCPRSPNCVSSQAQEKTHYIEPFQASLDDIKQAIKQMPEAAIVTEKEHYIHAEFRSKWLRFVDDVEFLEDPERRIVHVRSASRVGYSDLGVNRARVERIRRIIRG